MTAESPKRVRPSHVDWLLEHMTERDSQIVRELGRTRLLTSSQVERLCFADLNGRARSVVRSRVLKRLKDWRVLEVLPRRVGGRGSTRAVYYLDVAGQALAALVGNVARQRITVPGERFVHHALHISELYVNLVELARADGELQLLDYRAEPAAWVPDGLGGLLKPDAFLSLAGNGVADDWFCEIDLATEHLPTLKRKAET